MSGKFGIKVAKRSKRTPDTANPRENATDTSQKELAFDSDLNTFKYAKRGILTIGAQNLSTPPTYKVEHGLGYMPSFQLYSRKDGVIKQVTYDAGSDGPVIVPWVDKTYLNLLIHSGEGLDNIGFDLIYFIGADDLDNPDT